LAPTPKIKVTSSRPSITTQSSLEN
jgi:hypothetical protein